MGMESVTGKKNIQGFPCVSFFWYVTSDSADWKPMGIHTAHPYGITQGPIDLIQRQQD